MSTTTLDILRAARAKIADPSKWTQGAFARDKDDFPTEIRHGESFCALGALSATMHPWQQGLGGRTRLLTEAEAIVNRITIRMYGITLLTYNDRLSTQHHDILAIFDIAIAEEARNAGSDV